MCGWGGAMCFSNFALVNGEVGVDREYMDVGTYIEVRECVCE